MKKIIALLTLLALILTLVACGASDKKGDEDNNDGSATVGKSGVPTATLEGRESLTLETDLTIDGVTAAQTLSIINVGEYKQYYIQSQNGYEQYFVENSDGIQHYVRFQDMNEFTPAQRAEGEKITPPSLIVGFDAEKYLSDMSGEKAGEEKLGEYDCDVYEIEYTLNGRKYNDRVWADKESGIWVKSEFTDDNGAKGSYLLKNITDKCGDIPSTVPVKVTEGELYSSNGLTLNLKGIEFDPNNAATLKLEAVNATDSALKVYSDYFDVNGLCIGGSVFNVSVAAGESLAFDVEIPDKSCSIAGVDMIEEMEFAISASKYHVENDGEGSYDVSDGMLIEGSEDIKITTVCPAELKKEESGERRVLCSTPDFDVYFGGVRENRDGGYDFVVYYESEYSQDIRLTVNIFEVDGVNYDDYEKVYLQAGRKGFGGFSLWKDKVSERPTTMKLSFEAYYGELYNGTCILEETEPFVLTVG